MSCCCKPHYDDPIADIDRILINHAKPNLEWTLWQRLSRRYRFEVQWSYVQIDSTLDLFKIHNKDDEGRQMCLFTTDFTNNSKLKQNYSMKTTRETKSSVKVTVQKGFTLAGKLDMTLQLPSVPVAPLIDALSVTGGLSSSLSITKTREELFEDTNTWGVDSNVDVNAEKTTTASLMIQEEKALATFRVRHIIRKLADYDHLPIYVVHKRSGKVLLSYDMPFTKVVELLKKHKLAQNKDEDTIELFSSGVCDACYCAHQDIVIGEERPASTATHSTVATRFIPMTRRTDTPDANGEQAPADAAAQPLLNPVISP